MKPDASRLLAVIDRNLAEANGALCKLAAYRRLRQAGVADDGMNFFAIAGRALYNDMLAGAIRIFDDHKEAGSLWYILRCSEPAARDAAQACGIDLAQLRQVVPKLRHLRDRFYFHIDRRSVENAAAVWSDAGLSGEELAAALRDVACLLAKIRQDIFGGELARLAAYDGADVIQIVDAAKKIGRE